VSPLLRPARTLTCGSSAEEWAAQKCKAPFVKNQIAGGAGGKCGYSVFQIQCLSPVAYIHAVSEPFRSLYPGERRVVDLANLPDELSRLSVAESLELAEKLRARWQPGSVPESAGRDEELASPGICRSVRCDLLRIGADLMI